MISLLIAILALIGLFNLMIYLLQTVSAYGNNFFNYFNKRKNSIINFVFSLNADKRGDDDDRRCTRSKRLKRQ